MNLSLLDIFSQEAEMEAWALYSAQARANLLPELPIRIPVGTVINRAAQLGNLDDCTGRIMPRYLGRDIAYTVIRVLDSRIIGGCINDIGRFEPRERVYVCRVDDLEEPVVLDEALAMRVFAPDAEPKLIASVGQKLAISINGIRKEHLTIVYAGRRDGLPHDIARHVYASVRHLKPYEAVYALSFGKALAGAVDELSLAALMATPCRALVQLDCSWGYPIVSLRLCDESLKLQLTRIGSGMFIDNEHRDLLGYSKLLNQLVPNGAFQLGDNKWHIVMNMRVGQAGKELYIWREDGRSAWIPANVIEERMGALAHV